MRAWDFLRLIFGPGIFFSGGGGGGCRNPKGFFFGGGLILSPFDHRHPLKFLYLGRPFSFPCYVLIGSVQIAS